MKILFTLLFCTLTIVAFSQKKLPNITLKTLDGQTTNTNNYSNSDSIKVFTFWATWCVPCINELDAISEVYDNWQDETSVEIIAVSTDDARTKRRIKPLVNGKNWPYTVLLDENQEFKRALNISTIPHLVVVQNGKIVYRHSGYTPGSEDNLYEIIKKHSK